MKYDYVKAMVDYIKSDLEKNNEEDNELYQNYYDKLSKLTLKLVEYYTPVNNSYMKINEAGYKELDTLFKEAIKASQDFIDSPRDMDEVKMDDVRKQIAKNLHNEFLSESFVAFQNVKPDPIRSFKDNMDNFRQRSFRAVDDKTYFEINGHMPASDEVAIVEDYKIHSGNFIESTYYNISKDYKDLFAEFSNRYPKYKDFFEFVNSKREIIEAFHDVAYKPEGACIDTNDIKPDYINSIMEINLINDKNEFQALFEKYVADKEFAYACADLGIRMNEIYEKEDLISTNLELSTGDSLDKRAAAATGVAHVLGNDESLNKSKPVRIDFYKDGIPTSKVGTFTNENIGKNITNLSVDDPIRFLDAKAYDTDSAKVSIANLQIIDYICGNVNRNINNINFDFDLEKKELKGIQGTNNLESFMKVNTDGNLHHYVGLNNLNVIDEEMAAKVLALDNTTLKATLIGYGLDKEAIKAAIERTEKLQAAIKKQTIYEPNKTQIHKTSDMVEGTIYIVKKEDWKSLSLEELANSKEEHANIFKTVHDAQVNLNKELKEDKSLIDKCGVLKGTLNCKIENADSLLERARANKPLIGTSNRYINFIRSLELYKSSRNDEKLKSLKDVKVNVDTYIKEKIRDGVLDKNFKLLKPLTGKDLNRVNLVLETKAFIDEVDKIKKEHDEAFAKRENDIKFVDSINAKFRQGKYKNYPMAYQNNEGKIYINRDILKRDDAQFSELANFNIDKKANLNYVNKSIVIFKKQLENDYKHGRIPKEYYDYRIEKLDSHDFKEKSTDHFEPADPDSKYFANEFQNQIASEVNEKFFDVNNENEINNDIQIQKENEAIDEEEYSEYNSNFEDD